MIRVIMISLLLCSCAPGVEKYEPYSMESFPFIVHSADGGSGYIDGSAVVISDGEVMTNDSGIADSFLKDVMVVSSDTTLATTDSFISADKGCHKCGKCGKCHKHHKCNSVILCHIPPGNPGNAHTISVGFSAVPAHLAHGDYLGPCK